MITKKFQIYPYFYSVCKIAESMFSSNCPSVSLFVDRLLARDSMQSALYAVARPSLRLPVTRMDQSKMVEVRIMQLSCIE